MNERYRHVAAVPQLWMSFAVHLWFSTCKRLADGANSVCGVQGCSLEDNAAKSPRSGRAHDGGAENDAKSKSMFWVSGNSVPVRL